MFLLHHSGAIAGWSCQMSEGLKCEMNSTRAQYTPIEAVFHAGSARSPIALASFLVSKPHRRFQTSSSRPPRVIHLHIWPHLSPIAISISRKGSLSATPGFPPDPIFRKFVCGACLDPRGCLPHCPPHADPSSNACCSHGVEREPRYMCSNREVVRSIN